MKFLIILIVFFGVGCSKKADLLFEKEFEVSEKTVAVAFAPRVDILIVMDNSGSMSSHQKNIAAGADKFITALSENKFLDYHIGVITTSTNESNESGKLQGEVPYVTKDTKDGLNIIKRSIVGVGTRGDGTERFYDPIDLALSEPLISENNKGFLRDDAYLAIIIVSDTHDQSDIFDRETIIESLVEKKKFHKEAEKSIIAYGAITYDALFPGKTCADDQGDKPHIDTIEFIEALDGKAFSLCDDQTGQRLGEIGTDLEARIGRFAQIPELVDPSTIKLFGGNKEIKSERGAVWYYDEVKKGIVFEQLIEVPVGTNVSDFLSLTYREINEIDR